MAVMSSNHADPQDLALIQEVLKRFLSSDTHSVFVFGSRADGKAKQFSDFDLAIVGAPLKASLKADIEDAFEASSLPYLVELVEWYKVGEDFKKIAEAATIPIPL